MGTKTTKGVARICSLLMRKGEGGVEQHVGGRDACMVSIPGVVCACRRPEVS